ncbi:MAG: hypothetical protein E7504_08000 [Ruminococcus sp.]|nr:hypothetical protein [Ruminococcus sp.]
MYLSTLTFTLLVLPLLLFLFYLIPSRGKPVFLLLVGFLLYGWGNPIRLLVPAAYVFYDYGIGLLLQKVEKHHTFSRCIVIVTAVLQAAALTVVRMYANEDSEFLFPLGMAIFTLHGLGYLIGVHRRNHAAEVHFCNFALYLTFFPVLYAGPLISYSDFQEQLCKNKHHIVNLGSGLGLFVRGLAEKVVLADTLGYVFRELRQTDTASISMLTAWLTVIVFSMYLYFELLGYADMARGLGRCFGINLPKNFGQPFWTPSVTAFMESWNISHVHWFQKNFRDFLFRTVKHRWTKYASLVLMWMLIGLWYGSTLQFLLWGLFVGVLLATEQFFLNRILKRNYAFGLLYTGVSLQFAWVLLFAGSMSEAGDYWRAMLGFGAGLADRYGLYFFTSYIVFLLICFYIATDLFRNITERVAVTAVGKKIMSLMPLIECVLLIFCFACMLYKSIPIELWLKL